MRRKFARSWLALAAAALGMASLPAAAASPGLPSSNGPLAKWEQWRHITGVFDIAGPRSDGRFVLAANGELLLMTPDGATEPFARGLLDGYKIDFNGEPEAYIAVTAGHRDDADGCSFNRDDTFVLDTSKAGVLRVDASGTKSRYADIPAESVSGIAFDTTGSFSRRLLVTGPLKGKTAVYTVDCTGRVRTVTAGAPGLEGGIAVAPATFGAFAGALIAPDENSGRIYAIDPGGGVQTIATSRLPVGGDVGVERPASSPAGFGAAGGAIYTADRSTPGNAHPGTDTLLRLQPGALPSAVADGDLLVATEGGDLVEAVHCASSCSLREVAEATAPAHGEGHLVAIANGAGPTPAGSRAGGGPLSSDTATILAVAAGSVLVVVIVGALAYVIRRRQA